jgi:hypothetical protein
VYNLQLVFDVHGIELTHLTGPPLLVLFQLDHPVALVLVTPKIVETLLTALLA